MKHTASLVLATLSVFVTCAGAETLNIPSTVGHYGNECTRTDHGGITSTGETMCFIDMELPVPVGKTVKQITVFYGNGPGLPFFFAAIRAKTLTNGPDNNPNGSVLGSWSSASPLPAGDMAGVKLMDETGSIPYVVYPDAFTISQDRAYSLQIAVEDVSQFFGARILYQ